MTMPSQIAQLLKKQLNPVERFTDLLSGRDDRQDLQIMLLYEIAMLLSGQSEDQQPGQEFPAGMNVQVPLDVDTVDLMKKVKALTTDVIYPSSLADCRKALRMVIVIYNGFNQAVSADIIGNETNIATSGTFVLATINVPAGEARAYGIKNEEWMPYLGVQATPAVAPTAGEINASLIRQKQGKL